MFSSLKKALGLDPNERALKSYRKIVDEINSLEPRIQALSDEDILGKALAIKDQFRELEGQELSKAMEDRLPEVFAMVREASVRALGLRHFDVQMMGGIALHQGNIAEMKTGEGKTLVAPLAVILNALSGRGVHVVTVNDYLAKRDSAWMGPLYRAMGLSVGVIYSFMDPEERRRAYRSDITYGTNSEFGFDYLRDNMVLSQFQMVQRGHNYCIVDEVDSILVDEARTPLIISGPSEDSEEPYVRADQIASRLSGVAKDPNEVKPSVLDGQERPEPDGDFEFDEKRAIRSSDVSRNSQVRGGPLHSRPLHRHGSRRHGPQDTPGYKGQNPVQEGRPLHDKGQRDSHSGRVHRKAYVRSEILRRTASGHRGQGKGEDRQRKPDPGHHNPSELLQDVRKTGRYDRNSRDRGGGVQGDLRPWGYLHSHKPSGRSRGFRRPGLQDQRGEIRRR